VQAELSIALELRFIEPLIRRRLVRELRICPCVIEDVDRLVARQRRLQIQQFPRRKARFQRLVVNASEGSVQVAARLSFPRHAQTFRELDRNTQVDADAPDRIAQILERVVGIAASVDDDDAPAAPGDHLVESEVLEVSAV